MTRALWLAVGIAAALGLSGARAQAIVPFLGARCFDDGQPAPQNVGEQLQLIPIPRGEDRSCARRADDRTRATRGAERDWLVAPSSPVGFPASRAAFFHDGPSQRRDDRAASAQRCRDCALPGDANQRSARGSHYPATRRVVHAGAPAGALRFVAPRTKLATRKKVDRRDVKTPILLQESALACYDLSVGLSAVREQIYIINLLYEPFLESLNPRMPRELSDQHSREVVRDSRGVKKEHDE